MLDFSNEFLTVESAKEFIQSFRGEDYTLYGQKHHLEAETCPTQIDTIKLIEHWEKNTFIGCEIMNPNDLLEYCEEAGEPITFEESNGTLFISEEPEVHNNTYNWDSPLTNDLDYQTYHIAGSYITLVRFGTQFGDPRYMNYSSCLILKFDYEEGFIHSLIEDFYNSYSVKAENLDTKESFEFSVDLSVISCDVRIYSEEPEIDLECYGDLDTIRTNLKELTGHNFRLTSESGEISED